MAAPTESSQQKVGAVTTPADARHLERMLECTERMRVGTITLAEGADTLLSLRDALEAAEPGWAAELTDGIATLESAGTASPEQIAMMGREYPALVAMTLDTIERQVRDRMGES